MTLQPSFRMQIDEPINRLHVIVMSVLLCALHLGRDEYLSVQVFLLAIITIVFARQSIFDPQFWVILSILFCLHAVAVFASNQVAHYYLVAARSATTFAILANIAFRCQSLSHPSLQTTLIQALILALALSCGWAIAQLIDTLTLRTGLFDLPEAWFALEYGTQRIKLLQGSEYTQQFIRPTAGFSEPSALSALGIAAYIAGEFRSIGKLKILGALAVCVSLSLSGLLILTLIAITYASGSLSQRAIRLAGVLAVTLVLYQIVGDRIERISSGDDTSSLVRIFEPLRIIASTIQDGNFFGLPKDELTALSSEITSTIFDNWILNQVLLYGVLGIAIVLFCSALIPPTILPLFLAYGVMNGDALYYDRVVLLIVTTIIVAHPTYLRQS